MAECWLVNLDFLYTGIQCPSVADKRRGPGLILTYRDDRP
jgi:hypothetical protein